MADTPKDQVEFNLDEYDRIFDDIRDFENVLMEYHNDVDLQDISLDDVFSWLNETTESSTSGIQHVMTEEQNSLKTPVSVDKISMNNDHEQTHTPIKTWTLNQNTSNTPVSLNNNHEKNHTLIKAAKLNHLTFDKKSESNSQNYGMWRSFNNSLEAFKPDTNFQNTSVLSSAVSAVTRPELYNKITPIQVSETSTNKPMVHAPYAAESYPSMPITDQSLKHQSDAFTNFLSDGSVKDFSLNKSKHQPPLNNWPVSSATLNLEKNDTPPLFSRSPPKPETQKLPTKASRLTKKTEVKKPKIKRITQAQIKKQQSRTKFQPCPCNFNSVMNTQHQSFQQKRNFNTNLWNYENPLNNPYSRANDLQQSFYQNGINMWQPNPPINQKNYIEMQNHVNQTQTTHPYTQNWLGEPAEY